MKTIVQAGLLALLVSGAMALPVQEAGAATQCYMKNGHRVCNTVPAHRYRTVCTTSHGVKHCHKVAY